MRILWLHPNSWTGEYALLEHLRRQGEEVCVLEEKRGLGRAFWCEQHFRAPADRIETLWYDPGRGAAKLLTWPADRMLRGAFDGRNLAHRMWVVHRAARFFMPDVVVCSDGFSYAVPAALLRRFRALKAPLLVGFIGGDLLDRPEAQLGRRRTGPVRSLLMQPIRYADRLRPVSPLLAAELRALGAEDSRLEVTPSHLTAPRAQLDAVRARRAQIREAICARNSIAPGAPIVITLGGNYKAKGVHVLAAAWPSVLQQVPNARWLLCGPRDPWLAEGVEPLLRQPSVAPTVVMTGTLAQADAYEHLAAADLHVAPSLVEGLNIATVEAAALGTPSVTSDGAGIAPWIARIGCGAVVAAGDADALGRAIVEALRGPQRLALWRDRGGALADEFAIEQIGERLLATLESIVAPPRSFLVARGP